MNYTKRKERMLKMKESGYSLREIGEKFRVSKERVRQILLSGYRAKSDVIALIEKNRDSIRNRILNSVYGNTEIAKIASEYNVSAHTIYKHIGGRRSLLINAGLRHCYIGNHLAPVDEFSNSGRSCRKCLAERSWSNFRKRFPIYSQK